MVVSHCKTEPRDGLGAKLPPRHDLRPPRTIIAAMTDISSTAPSLADMLRGFSIEVNPGEPKVIGAAPQRLDPGTEVFMTWIPGKNPMDTIGPAKKLRDAGLY